MGLTIWLTILIIIIRIKSIIKKRFINVICLLIISLIFSFTTSQIFLFYFFFERSLIPIFIIIIGWGYQPERLRARLLLFFYTLFASLPLLVVLIFWNQRCYIFDFDQNSQKKINISGQRLIGFIAIVAFIVKFPIYAAHLWLPKAHVEAPVAGSMILAGLLLKLGGYGVLRLWFLIRNLESYSLWIILSIWGRALLGFICTRIRDIKVLIAYSSVVHISLVLVGVLSNFSWGVEGAIRVILAHGVCSSGIFAWANIIYERSHSRRLILNKGLLRVCPFISFWWFILVVRNFAGPFTLNLVGEIILIVSVLAQSLVFWASVAIISFFSAAYRLVAYRATQQGIKLTASIFWIESYSLENLVILCHVWPIFFLILSATFI